MLKIIQASDPILVEQTVTTIYAPPGTGKSTLGYSAEAPLLIDADQGAYRAAFRTVTAQAKAWDDIAGITAEDVKGFKTLVLDTGGRVLDLLAMDIIAANPKHGRGGALTLQGYGELKARFAAYLKQMKSFGLDIVIIAHSEEKQQGDEIIDRIDMQGSSKQEVYKSSDFMARLSIVNGKRVLSFSPTETKFGKDPARMGVVEVPDMSSGGTFLGDLIRTMKERLNAESAAQAEATAKLGEWAATVAEATTAADFNALIPKAHSKAEKKVLHDAATAAGCEFDKKAKAYTAPKVEGTEGEQAEWPFEGDKPTEDVAEKVA